MELTGLILVYADCILPDKVKVTYKEINFSLIDRIDAWTRYYLAIRSNDLLSPMIPERLTIESLDGLVIKRPINIYSHRFDFINGDAVLVNSVNYHFDFQVEYITLMI